MASPLQRLYKTKLTLLALLLTVAGAGLLLLSSRTSNRAGWYWLASLRPVEVGVALLTGGGLAVLLQYVGKRDADEQLRHELRQAIRSEAPAIRDAVINGFAFDPGALANVASPATLDRVAENSLTLQLGDHDLAHDVYRNLRQRILRTPERCYDGRISVALAPWDGGPAKGRGSMFVATIRWEYRTTTTTQPTFRFSCVSDRAEYQELLHDPTSAHTWYFEPVAGLTASSPQVFELVSFAVNGRQLPARRVTRAGVAQSYVVTLDRPARAVKDKTVSYTFRALVQRNSHLLHLDTSKPTKGFNVELFYGGCGIRYVNVLDYLGDSGASNHALLPATGPTPSIAVSLDGWVMPNRGIGFVWVFDDEIRDSASRFSAPVRSRSRNDRQSR